MRLTTPRIPLGPYVLSGPNVSFVSMLAFSFVFVKHNYQTELIFEIVTSCRFLLKRGAFVNSISLNKNFILATSPETKIRKNTVIDVKYAPVLLGLDDS